jgi:glycosyltransferase involved in cell wall biosynthesis
VRIAFVSQPRDSIGPSLSASGSVGIVVAHLARELAARHQVMLLAPSEADQPSSEQACGVDVRRIGPVARLLHDGLDFLAGLSPALPSHTASQFYYAEYYAAAARALRAWSPDAIVLETFAQAAARLRCAVPSARLLLHAHDPRLALLATAKRDVRALDGVVTVSRYLTAGIATAHPNLPAVTIGNGVDPSAFAPGATPLLGNRLLYVGRVSPEKGLHLLMPAMNAVVAIRPDARLDVVGPPGLLPYTHVRLFGADAHWASLDRFYGRTMLQRWQLRSGASAYAAGLQAALSPEASMATTFSGRVAHASLPAHYAAAGLFVLPSLCDEPFGIPLVEAMAAGLPVVATRTGGIPEIVADGETGLLVERGDIAGLTQAILALLDDPGRRHRMGMAGRERAGRMYTWANVASRLESALAAS